jgi:predicted MFS family arabinose efflux permease
VPRRPFVAASLGVLALSLIAIAAAPSAWVLAGAIGLAGAASGAACGAAQGELLERYGDPERAMSRWVVFGGVGDVITPLGVAILLGSGGSYRAALVAVAAIVGAQAALVLRAPATVPVGQSVDDPEDADGSLREALRTEARRPAVWLWLLGAATCTLLDEVVAALAALRLRLDLGASDALASASLACLSGGFVGGALVMDRLAARWGSTRVLAASALLCAAALALVVAAPSAGWMIPALLLLGASAAPHYAWLKARAYQLVPGRPGLVNAIYQVYVVIDVVAPLALGACADAFGLRAALACLVVQPLTVFALVALLSRGQETRSR